MKKIVTILVTFFTIGSIFCIPVTSVLAGDKAVDMALQLGRELDHMARDFQVDQETRNFGYKTAVGVTKDFFDNMLNGAAKREERKHKVELAKAETKAKFQAIMEGAQNFVSNPKAIGGMVAVIAGFFVLMHGTRFAREYVESVMGQPQLVKETSIKTLNEKIKDLFFPSRREKLTAKDIILNGSLKKQFVDIVKLTSLNRQKGHGYSHLLFYGPPGTGKTLGAKIVSQMSGMDYAVIAGSSFTQYKMGKDIQELDKLIRWAIRSDKGIVLFIDEADSALGKRTGKSERGDNLVNYFLSNFEKTTHPKIKLVLATNHPERLDPAVLSRMSNRVFIGLPDNSERLAQIKLNVSKVFHAKTPKDKIAIDPSFDEYVSELATKTSGFTGRDLFDLTIKLRDAVDLSGTKTLNDAIAKEVLESSKKAFEDRQKMEEIQEKEGHAYFKGA